VEFLSVVKWVIRSLKLMVGFMVGILILPHCFALSIVLIKSFSVGIGFIVV
jgi:hypothetical protein